ncbi:MAG: 4-alpha-glucanotransferase [Actinomycetota bacterium]|nr:4-alpha-glucanotransferase [Actinomycetota bacterium]
MDAGAWGVAERYQRADGEWVDAPEATLDAILGSMGAGDGDRPPDSEGLCVVHAGQPVDFGRPVRLTTEDGGDLDLDGPLPPDVPLGYHTVTDREDGSEVRLIVSPGRCFLPEGRGWGWAVQLYAVRSRESWGIGDLADLRRIGKWSAAELGARLLLLNPLHAALPGLPQTASPYFPSSRQFRNPLYLRVEEVPGAADLGGDLEKLAAEGRALNGDRRINRDEVYRLKLEALTWIWERFPGDPSFDAYCEAGGSSLEGYATFCTLTEEFGRPWREWSQEYRYPDAPEVGRFRQDRRDRVRFHQWLQWLVDRQLADAGAGVSLIEDLAVGVDPAGADGWLWQGVLAAGMSVGAPPDEFNTQGQNWGVPPFDPWRLRAAAYAPFVETIRASLRHGGGMRLDHVMGLFRLFWVPQGASPKEGTYVRYPASDLLDIVALESHRAGAYVVGEDLGTVETEVRVELAARNILSYRLLWFESAPPAEWPVHALAAVTTHDLPTIAGLWRGTDLDVQRSLDLEPNEESTVATRERLAKLAGADDDTRVEEVVAAAYDALSQTPCLLLTATLDDALAVEERPNMPGTTDQWPNWCIALPAPLEDIEEHPGPRRIAQALSRPPLP